MFVGMGPQRDRRERLAVPVAVRSDAGTRHRVKRRETIPSGSGYSSAGSSQDACAPNLRSDGVPNDREAWGSAYACEVRMSGRDLQNSSRAPRKPDRSAT